jgi:hypothetical protein
VPVSDRKLISANASAGLSPAAAEGSKSRPLYRTDRCFTAPRQPDPGRVVRHGRQRLGAVWETRKRRARGGFQNMPLSLADLAGMFWMTSQCSTSLPFSRRKKSASACPGLLGLPGSRSRWEWLGSGPQPPRWTDVPGQPTAKPPRPSPPRAVS